MKVESILAQVIKELLISMEMYFLEMVEDEKGEEKKADRSDVHCAELARAFFIHKSMLATETLGINLVSRIGEGLGKIK